MKVKRMKTKAYADPCSLHYDTVTKQSKNVPIIPSSPTLPQSAASLPQFNGILLENYFKDQQK